jgi:hypothetical protein
MPTLKVARKTKSRVWGYAAAASLLAAGSISTVAVWPRPLTVGNLRDPDMRLIFGPDKAVLLHMFKDPFTKELQYYRIMKPENATSIVATTPVIKLSREEFIDLVAKQVSQADRHCSSSVPGGLLAASNVMVDVKSDQDKVNFILYSFPELERLRGYTDKEVSGFTTTILPRMNIPELPLLLDKIIRDNEPPKEPIDNGRSGLTVDPIFAARVLTSTMERG